MWQRFPGEIQMFVIELFGIRPPTHCNELIGFSQLLHIVEFIELLLGFGTLGRRLNLIEIFSGRWQLTLAELDLCQIESRLVE